MRDWLGYWAEVAPSRPAMIDATAGRTFTYADLSDRAERFAALLEEHGIRPGDRVAVLSANRTEVFELLFACGRIGAMLVPLNWRLAPAELRTIVEDAEPAGLIHDAECTELANAALESAPDATCIVLGDPAEDDPPCAYRDHRGAAAATDRRSAGLEDVALILYTSGTTGRPKGAMLPWRQLLFNAINTTLACDLRSDDRCLAFLPLFHTGGINCLATPLLHRGGTVVLMRRFDAQQSLELFASHGITTVIGVPTMYEALLDAGLRERSLPRLRVMLCGGAPCPPDLLERYHEADLPLRQGYGLTEVGPNCFTLSPLDGLHRIGSVGKPVCHSEVRLVDDEGRDVPAGEAGELWLRGPHVTAGYWRRPDATHQAFAEKGWFRTGDCARRTEDGFFYVVDRKKDMYISGGENVYPAEIESVLSAHPAVRRAAVVGVPDSKWGEVGLATVVLSNGQVPETVRMELRDWVREHLAKYKTPSHWRFVDALPTNATGKVRKDLLRKAHRPI